MLSTFIAARLEIWQSPLDSGEWGIRTERLAADLDLVVPMEWPGLCSLLFSWL